MRVLVGVKRVIDFATPIRVRNDEKGVENMHVKMSMNPFDEIAVEEAVRLKEKGIVTEIIVVSIGPNQNQETLRTAFAIGADRGILIETDQEIQPLGIAKIFRVLAEKELPHLIILGKQAIDSDDNQVGQMLAGLLNWSQGTFASKIEIENDFVTVTREIDGGLETLKLKCPTVITTDLRLNEPRYLSLPNIVKAKKKSLSIIPLSELNIDTSPRLEILKITAPAKRRAGIKVENAKELIDKLRFEARVI